MRNWLCLTFLCAAASICADLGAAQTQPIPDNPVLAQTSLGFNPKTRCPDLRIADEGTIAVVIFWVPRSGIPSQISIKSSSGSSDLDSAAISCVSKLRFAPATRLGDGEPIDSWQQIAWRWAERSNANETRTAGPASEPVPMTTEARQHESGGQANSATVHVCVDETGKLKQDPTIVHSSGKASLDQAAVKIAASGSAYYPASGCAQLAIKFETK